jgi:ornithine cyclodeaminase/alanine dehydrogenase-like protein (mu-crystallin family)
LPSCAHEVPVSRTAVGVHLQLCCSSQVWALNEQRARDSWSAVNDTADDAAARRSRIFVDHRASAFDGVGDILQPIASGAIRKEDVLGDLYDLVGGGVPGRLGTNDITFFKSAGGGHLDLMTAQAIMSQLDAV